MPHKRSQEGAFLRYDGPKRKPRIAKAPLEIYVAIDQSGNIHDTNKDKELIDEHVIFMRKTFKISLKCIRYTREDKSEKKQ